MNKNTVSYAVIIILFAVTSVFSLRLFFQEKSSHDRVDIRSFPYEVGEWKGTDLAITEEEYEILETRNLLSREYRNPAGERLYLFVVYSETNRSVFHPPEVCMIGSGAAIVDKKLDEVIDGGRQLAVNKMYAEKKDSRQLILYSYKAGGFYTASYYIQQCYLALNQILSRHVPGATIRASMLIGKDEESALAALKGFFSETAKIVDGISRV